MTRSLNRILNGLIAVSLLTVSCPALAWTAAHLFSVNVQVDVSESGVSTVTTEARFVVEAGYFHGFDMVDLPNGTLDEAAAVAVLDDKRTLPVIFKRIRKDGRVRVLLDDDRFVRKGGITFKVVHTVDMVKSGAISFQESRARLDWTPLVWEVGLDAMALTVALPGVSRDDPVRVDPDIARDYVVENRNHTITAVKYRPVKWYPMRLVLDFDPALIDGLRERDNAAPAVIKPISAVQVDGSRGGASSPARTTPLLFALLGFVALLLKARHVTQASRGVGVAPRFMLLRRTGISTRTALAFGALSTGLLVQWAGHLAASIPAVAAAAALLVLNRDPVPLRPRSGGQWRLMSATDFDRFAASSSAYRRSRRSLVDATCLRGAAALGIYLGLLLFTAMAGVEQQSDTTCAAVVNALVLGIPAWFGSIRSELPVDPMLEGFAVLKRWERSLAELLGAQMPGSSARFFVREMNGEPVEVRIRAASSVEGLRHIEVAGEVLRTGTIYKARTVFVLRLEPGSALARTLAACPGAAEHHLTPDLEEEIIVLRHRRGLGRTGLAPLRSALAMMG